MNAQSLSVSGPMTIYEASDWREQLLNAVKPGKPLEVDLHTSGPWDISGLQLLISLTRSGDHLESPVRFLLVPPGCREIARRAGLTDWLKKYTISDL